MSAATPSLIALSALGQNDSGFIAVRWPVCERPGFLGGGVFQISLGSRVEFGQPRNQLQLRETSRPPSPPESPLPYTVSSPASDVSHPRTPRG